MSKNKLITLLKAFDKEELKRFVEFSHSPYFNKSSQVQRLVEVIYNCYPTFEISKEKLYEKVFDTEQFDDLALRRIYSKSFKLCEEFCGIEQFRSSEEDITLNIVKDKRQRNLDKQFAQSSTKIIAEEEEVRDATFYKKHYALLNEQTQFVISKGDRTKEPKIEALSDALDKEYIVNKIRLICSSKTFSNLFKTNYSIAFEKEVIDFATKADKAQDPLIYAYYNIYKLLTNQNADTTFKTLKQYLSANTNKFTQEDLQELLLMARNFCIKRINKGVFSYYKEVFDLYKIELDADLWATSISPFSYKNIVSTALHLKEFNWTKEFIENYKTRLPEAHQHSQYTFNMARLFFAQKQYNQVISLLSQVEYNDFFLNLSAKSMLLKTYYELEEFDALYSLIDSFRVYLNRYKRKMAYHRKLHINFINYLNKIAGNQRYSKKKLAQVKQEIQGLKEIVDPEWLVEKVEELL